MDDTLKRVKESMVAAGIVETDYDLKPEHHLTNDLDMDSLDRIDFAMEVEREFEIQISDLTLDDFQTVADIVKFIDEEPK